VNCTLRIYIYAFSDPPIRTDLIKIVRALICTKSAIRLDEQKEDAAMMMPTHQPQQLTITLNDEDDNDLFDLEDVQHEDPHLTVNKRPSIVARTLASISRKTTMFDNHPYCPDRENKGWSTSSLEAKIFIIIHFLDKQIHILFCS
jgi:hypothetical protein